MRDQCYTIHLHTGEFGINLTNIMKAAGRDHLQRQKFLQNEFAGKETVFMAKGLPYSAFGIWVQLVTALEACDLLSMSWMKPSLQVVYAELKANMIVTPPTDNTSDLQLIQVHNDKISGAIYVRADGSAVHITSLLVLAGLNGVQRQRYMDKARFSFQVLNKGIKSSARGYWANLGSALKVCDEFKLEHIKVILTSHFTRTRMISKDSTKPGGKASGNTSRTLS
jgi:hypothetical protein